MFSSGCDHSFLAFLCCFSFKWYLSTLEFWERGMKNNFFGACLIWGSLVSLPLGFGHRGMRVATGHPSTPLSLALSPQF